MSDEPSDRRRQLRAMLREALAVLAAILVAFALDAWWDGRVERRDAVAALRNLDAELGQNIAALDSTVVRNRLVVEAARSLAGTAPDDLDERSEAELEADLGGISGFLAVNPETGALNSLLTSGWLVAVRDEGLRSAISGLPQAWDEVTEDGDIAAGLWTDAAKAMVETAGSAVMLDVAAGTGSVEMRRVLSAWTASDELKNATSLAAIFTMIYVAELQGLRVELASLSERVRGEIGR